MRIPLVAFAVVPLLLSSDTPAKADFLLNCRLIDSGNPVYREHCKEDSEVIRIRCQTKRACLLLRKLIGSSQAVSDVDVPNSATGVTGTVSGAGSTFGGTVSGAGSAVGGTLSGAGSTLGGTVSGAGSAVGGTVSGSGSAVGGAVSGAGSRLGGRL